MVIEKIQTVIGPLNSVDKINEIIEKINNAETSGLSIGTIFPCVCSADWTPENALPVDGTEYVSSQFLTLWSDYLTATTPKLATCTYDEYASDIATYGQCAKFAVDTTNNKFKVPTIKDGSYITQALSNTEIGKAHNESLPNIKGTFNATSGVTTGCVKVSSGAGVYNQVGNSTQNEIKNLSINASDSSSTYQDNAKVQGDNVRLRWFVVVANGTVSQAAMDWSAWQQGLSTKVNNADLTELTSIFAPDYSTAVSFTLPYTAPYNCVVYFRENDLLNNQTTQVAVDGETVFYKWSSQGYQQPVSALIPLKKGQVLSLTSGSVVDLKSFAYSEEVQYA